MNDLGLFFYCIQGDLSHNDLKSGDVFVKLY